ncbi:hypothetical protein ACHAWF_004686, partial [Thalassiosira exigua]
MMFQLCHHQSSTSRSVRANCIGLFQPQDYMVACCPAAKRHIRVSIHGSEACPFILFIAFRTSILVCCLSSPCLFELAKEDTT